MSMLAKNYRASAASVCSLFGEAVEKVAKDNEGHMLVSVFQMTGTTFRVTLYLIYEGVWDRQLQSFFTLNELLKAALES